jgi:Rieske Fe-S protein
MCDNCPVVAPDVRESRRDFLRDAMFAAVFVTGIGGRNDKAYPMPAVDGVAVDKAESVIVARFENKVYAFSLACPHQNTALRWDKGAGRFQCPKHKSRYKPDGAFIDGRATRGLDRFAVKREGGQLMVNLDVLYEQDKQVADWRNAFIQL